jgi:hypothetical protein
VAAEPDRGLDRQRGDLRRLRSARGRRARARPTLPAGPGAVAKVLDRAVAHGDEHVIKFTDTAAEVYARTGQADALAAALRVGTLIPSPRD